jgi:hypothetical protein
MDVSRRHMLAAASAGALEIAANKQAFAKWEPRQRYPDPSAR